MIQLKKFPGIKRSFIITGSVLLIITLIFLLPKFSLKYRILKNISHLKSANAKTREVAAANLVKTGSPAVEQLAFSLKYDGTEIGSVISRELAKVFPSEKLEDRRKRLKKESAVLKRGICGVLGDIGDPSAIPALIGELSEADKDVQKEASIALGKIGVPTVKPLEKLLNDKNSSKEMKIIVVETLGLTGAKEAVPPLIEAMKDMDYMVRDKAISVLAGMGALAYDDLVKSFKENFLEANPDNSSSGENLGQYRNMLAGKGAKKALLRIRDPKTTDKFIQTLNDDYESLRKISVTVLGEIGGARAVPPLINALKIEFRNFKHNGIHGSGKDCSVYYNFDYMLSLINVLAKMSDKRCEDALISILDSPADEEVIKAVINAFREIGSKKAERHVLSSRYYHNKEMWEEIAKYLVSIDSIHLFPYLKYTVENCDDSNKDSLFRLIADLKDPESENLLISCLFSDSRLEIRKLAAYYLGEKGSEKSVKYLIKALKNNSDAQDVIIVALGNIGDPSAVEPIMEFVRSGNGKFYRLEVVKALGSFDTPEIIDFLVENLGSLSDSTRKQAMKSLYFIGEPAVLKLNNALKSDNEEIRKGAADVLKIMRRKTE